MSALVYCRRNKVQRSILQCTDVFVSCILSLRSQTGTCHSSVLERLLVTADGTAPEILLVSDSPGESVMSSIRRPNTYTTYSGTLLAIYLVQGIGFFPLRLSLIGHLVSLYVKILYFRLNCL